MRERHGSRPIYHRGLDVPDADSQRASGDVYVMPQYALRASHSGQSSRRSRGAWSAAVRRTTVRSCIHIYMNCRMGSTRVRGCGRPGS